MTMGTLGRPNLSYGHEMNYTFACTMKLYDIFKAKNVLVIAVYCVMAYIICNLVLKYMSMGMVEKNTDGE
jgi:hypothetical protein